MRAHLRDVLLLGTLSAVLLLPGLGSTDLFNPDEPREGEIAREMRVSGDFVVPQLDGCPFLEKPPFFYWLVTLASHVPGLSPEVEVRLPSVLAMLLLVLVTYAVGRELFDRRVGRAAAFCFLTGFQPWWMARRALLDPTLAFFVGATILFVLMGLRRPSARLWLFPLAGVACSGAVMTKGLIGIVVPALTLIPFLAYRRNLSILWSPLLLASAALPLLAVTAWVLMLLRRPDGPCMVHEFLIVNHLGRFLGTQKTLGHRQPFWFYVEYLPGFMFPWGFFLPSAVLSRRGVVRASAERRYAAADGTIFLACWILPSLALLCVSSTKRAIYLLPLIPPCTILVAKWWRSRRSSGPWLWVPGLALLAVALFTAFLLPTLAANLDRIQAQDAVSWLWRLPTLTPFTFLGVALVLATAFTCYRSQRRGLFLTMLLTYGFLLFSGSVLLPMVSPRTTGRSIGNRIHEIQARGQVVVALHITEGSLGQFLFYSNGTLPWIVQPGPRSKGDCVSCRLAASSRAPRDNVTYLMTTQELASYPRGFRSRGTTEELLVGGASFVLFTPGERAGGSLP